MGFVNGDSPSSRYRHRYENGGRRDTATLPATSAQRRFAISAETTERKLLVPYGYTLAPGSLTLSGLRERLDRTVNRHPALQCDLEYSDDGLIVQQRRPERTVPCDEASASGSEDEAELTRALLTAAEDPDLGGPVRARLLHGAGHDRLVLAFDHAVMDAHSLGLVTAALFDEAGAGPAGDESGTSSGSEPNSGADPWSHYQDAVWNRLESETLAGSDPDGIAYWVARLAPAVKALRTDTTAAGDDCVITDPDPVPIGDPAAVRPTLFPRLLAATHRALHAERPGPSAVIYPWGLRPPQFSDVVGCFMNTVLSVDTAEAEDSADSGFEAFAEGCWSDFEYADVPFDDVVLAVSREVGGGWPGTARCLLGLEDVSTRGRAGPPDWDLREWLPTWLRPKCVVNATARYCGDRLDLRLVVDPEQAPAAGVARLTQAWRDSLAALLAP